MLSTVLKYALTNRQGGTTSLVNRTQHCHCQQATTQVSLWTAGLSEAGGGKGTNDSLCPRGFGGKVLQCWGDDSKRALEYLAAYSTFSYDSWAKGPSIFLDSDEGLTLCLMMATMETARAIKMIKSFRLKSTDFVQLVCLSTITDKLES